MERISEIIKKSDLGHTQPLPPSTHRSSTITKYGNKKACLARFDKRNIMAYNIDECLWGDYPTLSDLNEAYGNGMSELWLATLMPIISEFSGSKEKLSDIQLDFLVQTIVQGYGFLKVTEIFLFIRLFMAGKYGKFFGGVDPLTITSSLKDFVDNYRSENLKRINEEMKRKALEEENERMRNEAVKCPPEILKSLNKQLS